MAPLFDLQSLVALAEHEHLAARRPLLLERVIERRALAAPGEMTPAILKRLLRLEDDQRSLTVLLFMLAAADAAPAATRQAARAAARGRFPLHAEVARQLGTGPRRVLIVHNVADQQGDEIIRVVPLAQALLDYNPQLDVTLVTSRAYLYAHPRLWLAPIDDPGMVGASLRGRYDGEVDCFEPNVLELNYDVELERQVQALVARSHPFLRLHVGKGYNHFTYQTVELDGRPLAQALGLDRQRVPNVYETTLRLGEQRPTSETVLAALPSEEAESAWRALTAGNTQGQPGGPAQPLRRRRAPQGVRGAQGRRGGAGAAAPGGRRLLRDPAPQRDALGQ